MKVSASLLSSLVTSPRVSPYAQKLAARLEPGQTVEFVGGSRVRVLQKNASPNGMHFVVRAKDGTNQSLSFRQFAALGPVSPAMRRFAAFFRHMAFDAMIDTYVKSAIREAGWPVDNDMDWSKYLTRIFGPVLRKQTKDQGQIDEIIRDLVLDELYTKHRLSPSSPHAHFDPDHEKLGDKPLDKRVSAYLTMIFGHRKEVVRKTLQRMHGMGAGGNLGLVDTVSLDQKAYSDEHSNETLADITPDEKDHAIETLEGQDEVNAFIRDFKTWLGTRKRKVSLKGLLFLTDCFTKDIDRTESRKLMVGNPKFQGRSGKPLKDSDYNHLLALWSRQVRAFSEDPKAGWAGMTLSRHIADEAERVARVKTDRKQEKAEKKKDKEKPTIASLRLAAFEPEPPQNPNVAANTAPPPPPPAPPPINPNVVQQNAAKPQPALNGLNTAQPEQQTDPNAPNAPKKTIDPEIPGVNHTAASKEEPTMPETKIASKRKSVEARLRQRRLARKFASLRRIATEEPAEVGIALRELREMLNGLEEQLSNLEDHLDVKETPKEASIRQKVAHRNTFARGLQRLASEQPEELEVAVNDFYSELNDLVTGVESLADNLGLTLDLPEENGEQIQDDFVEELPDGDTFEEETTETEEPELPVEPVV